MTSTIMSIERNFSKDNKHDWKRSYPNVLAVISNGIYRCNENYIRVEIFIQLNRRYFLIVEDKIYQIALIMSVFVLFGLKTLCYSLVKLIIDSTLSGKICSVTVSVIGRDVNAINQCSCVGTVTANHVFCLGRWLFCLFCHNIFQQHIHLRLDQVGQISLLTL